MAMSQEAKERARIRMKERWEQKRNGGGAAVLEPPQIKKKALKSFIVFNRPSIGEAEIEAVSQVLRSSWIGSGPIVKEFEAEFAKFIGKGYAVAASSCTDALLMALKVLSIGDKAEVITTPLTFAATTNAILLSGAKPVFVDVDPSGNLDAEQIRFKLTNQTKAIMPVHLYGAACEMGRIWAAAKSFDLKLIDDCAHAFGGYYVSPTMQAKIGTLADISCFSLYANKNITSAEGGMIMTQRGDWAERMRQISFQGLNAASWRRYSSDVPSDYEVIHEGIKGNMSDVHAAIGLTQLRRWPELKTKRDKVWDIYERTFGPKEQGHARNIFTIRVKNRDEFRRRLHAEGIGTGVHYRPLHLEPGFKFLGYVEGNFPLAEKIGRETVSLPVSAAMTEEEANYVVDTASRYMEVA